MLFLCQTHTSTLKSILRLCLTCEISPTNANNLTSSYQQLVLVQRKRLSLSHRELCRVQTFPKSLYGYDQLTSSYQDLTRVWRQRSLSQEILRSTFYQDLISSLLRHKLQHTSFYRELVCVRSFASYSCKDKVCLCPIESFAAYELFSRALTGMTSQPVRDLVETSYMDRKCMALPLSGTLDAILFCYHQSWWPGHQSWCMKTY